MLGSETGMLRVEPQDVKRLGRLAPGKLFCRPRGGAHRRRREVKEKVATQQPYGEWYEQNVVHFKGPRARARHC